MKRLGDRLTYANVMATIAVFIALGGGAYAATLKKNSVGTSQLKKNAVTGAKVKDGSLSAADIGGAVSSASRAATADSAAHATTAETAAHATTANSSSEASHAIDSDKLGGSAPSAFVQASQVGSFIAAPGVEHSNFGCPFDLTSWHDKNPETNETTAYWRDPFGVVHLRGFAIRCGTAEDMVFTLPQGFRPGKLQRFVAILENPTLEIGQVTVAANGDVVASEVTTNNSVSLDGITFKCAPSGSNGCP